MQLSSSTIQLLIASTDVLAFDPSEHELASRKHINDIPSEILPQIFYHGKHADYRFALLVSWVSRYWRKLAVSAHSLWDTIYLFNSDMVSEYLERNPEGPINIIAGSRGQELVAALSCLDLLRSHRHRFQGVSLAFFDIDACGSDRRMEWRSLIFYYFDVFGVPLDENPLNTRYHLRTFSIQSRPKEPKGITLDVVGNIIFPLTYTLRTVHLREMAVHLTDMQIAALRYAIKSLSMTRVFFFAVRPTIRGWFFQRMPQLEHLSLISVDIFTYNLTQLGNHNTSPSPQDILILEHLCSLRVLRSPKANRFLSHLCAPKLRHFEWEVDFPTPGVPGFWHICASRLQALTSLHLMGFPSEGEGANTALSNLTFWLESLRYLESLVLIFDRFCISVDEGVGSENGVVHIL